MTVPAWLENAEAEDAAELAALIGIDTAAPLSDSAIDAMASDVCRLLRGVQADLARYREAEVAEKQRIEMFYRSRKEPLELRILQLQAIGEELAARAHFPGKSKSRAVAFGCYGSRKIPEKVEVVDEETAITWLRATAGVEALREKIEIDKKEARKLVLRHLDATGEVAPGFTHVGESESYFIKADA